MNILFYYPSDQRSISLESQMQEFGKLGHEIHLLGTVGDGALQERARNMGVTTSVHLVEKSDTLTYYWRHVRALIGYVKEHRIDIVYANTQPANLVAVFSQYLQKSRYILCRHHSDYIYKGTNKNAKRVDRLINWLGREFIVVSQRVVDQMIHVEGVSPDTIRHIDLGYDFSRYPLPSHTSVKAIRGQYPCKMLLTVVSRFIDCKRYPLLLRSLAYLINDGRDLRLLILGHGPLENDIRALIDELAISERVHIIGHTTQVMDYMSAADVIVHPSESEASSNVIKEAGLLGKTVIACTDVGDVDSYISSGEQGVLLSKTNTESELIEAVARIYDSPESFDHMGAALKKAVLQKFSIDNVISEYTEVLPRPSYDDR